MGWRPARKWRNLFPSRFATQTIQIGFPLKRKCKHEQTGGQQNSYQIARKAKKLSCTKVQGHGKTSTRFMKTNCSGLVKYRPGTDCEWFSSCDAGIHVTSSGVRVVSSMDTADSSDSLWLKHCTQISCLMATLQGFVSHKHCKYSTTYKTKEKSRKCRSYNLLSACKHEVHTAWISSTSPP